MSTLKVNNIADLGNDAVVTSGVLDTLAVPAGGILQVVSTTKTDTFSASLGSGVRSGDITGLTATITPRSVSSKIFALANVPTGHDNASNQAVSVTLFRDGSILSSAAGDAAGTRQRITGQAGATPDHATNVSISFLDSPATISSLTYSLRLSHASSSTKTLYVNRQGYDVDGNSAMRSVSTITLIEVAG